MKLWIRSSRHDLAYAGLVVGALLLWTCSGPLAEGAAHFRFGSGEAWLSIQSFDRETGALVAIDHRHNIRWEMQCGLGREEREPLIAAPGVVAKMRFQKNEHDVALELGRLRPGQKAEMVWVGFVPVKVVLL